MERIIAITEELLEYNTANNKHKVRTHHILRLDRNKINDRVVIRFIN